MIRLHRQGMTRRMADLAGHFLCLPPEQLTNSANAMTQLQTLVVAMGSVKSRVSYNFDDRLFGWRRGTR
jgi:hypothetical protein